MGHSPASAIGFASTGRRFSASRWVSGPHCRCRCAPQMVESFTLPDACAGRMLRRAYRRRRPLDASVSQADVDFLKVYSNFPGSALLKISVT